MKDNINIITIKATIYANKIKSDVVIYQNYFGVYKFISKREFKGIVFKTIQYKPIENKSTELPKGSKKTKRKATKKNKVVTDKE